MLMGTMGIRWRSVCQQDTNWWVNPISFSGILLHPSPVVRRNAIGGRNGVNQGAEQGKTAEMMSQSDGETSIRRTS